MERTSLVSQVRLEGHGDPGSLAHDSFHQTSFSKLGPQIGVEIGPVAKERHWGAMHRATVHLRCVSCFTTPPPKIKFSWKKGDYKNGASTVT